LTKRVLLNDNYNWSSCDPQSFNLFAYVRGNPTNYWDPLGLEGGIMERLARQPRVADMNDVLRTMNSFECDASWSRVFQNMAMTNSLGIRVWGFKLFGASNAATRIGETLTGTNVAAELGLPTVRQFVFGGFRGMTIEGASFTGLEAGVLTGAGVGTSFVLTSTAWEAGVFAGSVLNVAATAPCHYGH